MKKKIAAALLFSSIAVAMTQSHGGRSTEALPPFSTPTKTNPDALADFSGAKTEPNPWLEATNSIEARAVFVTAGKGDTLATLLERAGIETSQRQSVLDALVKIYNPRDLKPGQELRIDYAQDDWTPGQVDFQRLTFQASVERDVAVEHELGTSRYRATATKRALSRTLTRTSGVIQSSLYQAGAEAGLPNDVLFELFRDFSYDVDFQRDIQPGDRFDAVYDQLIDENGKAVRNGQLRYASMTLSGVTLRIYRFESADGTADYYNEKGASIRKALLRTPIDGAKLTSHFGMRNHPLLGYTLMHRGVDFGAVSGTPIMAAGDGTIDKMGANGGYGNYVRLRHNSQYSTAYAHMSRFAHGLHAGSHVRQGDIIGFVGATGLATGPHLHYEVLVGDRQINPLSVKLPTGHQLDGKDIQRFRSVEAEIDRALTRWPEPAAVASLASLSGIKN
jgi:murein DD-endopeptidase MepM/ murein hydrolase activator NlpD